MLWRYVLLVILLPCIYAIFGWYIAQETDIWSRWLLQRGDDLEITLILEQLDLGIYVLAAVLITTIALGLTFFTEQLALLLSGWFKTDVGAIVAILGWSLAVVFMLRWWGDFARVLVLIAAAILGRLELQEAGYNRLQIFFTLTFLCLGSFVLGIWAHGIWGELFHGRPASIR
ncbi:hypothetical protein V0288_18230 [Pannus brasiliensis CCIBt3594]|uniref:Uncharacterized protein n=1 Tax=Pannus brasiliensis CCIBt3594 TaxID=1427578 RepID=A0AAW9QV84_9CHRO